MSATGREATPYITKKPAKWSSIMCTAHRAEQRQWTKPLTESAVQATPSTLRRSADILRLNHRFRALSHRKAAPQRCITTKALIPSHSMRMAVRVRRRVSPRSTLPMPRFRQINPMNGIHLQGLGNEFFHFLCGISAGINILYECQHDAVCSLVGQDLYHQL